MIYLDNSATTRPFDEVTALMADVQKNTFGNPSSLHHAGVLAERAVMNARNQALKALGDETGTFVFTSGGTEANNLAVLGTQLSKLKRCPKIISSKIEHPSVTEPIRYLQELGACCRFVGVDSKGRVDKEEFVSLLEEDTSFVSIMMVNNEIGSVQQIGELAQQAKAKNPKVLFHTDAVQALGKISVNAQQIGVDMISVSGHKINGPKGVGGLYIRRGVHVKPILHGGGQERGLRSGTENTACIAGFGLAINRTMSHMKETSLQMDSLRHRLMMGLEEISGCRVITDEASAPHVVCVTFPGLKSETLLHALEAREIFVSSGSACSSNKPQLSPTLLAMGLDKREIEGALRFSLGFDTTEEEIDRAIAAVAKETDSLLGV